MALQGLDWGIIGAYFIISLLIGLLVARKSGSSVAEFFLSGRNMPWWLLGISMVATTFSADTPNLVTDIVRNNGVGGNWVWWAFLLTGMMTVFVYAKLWRRTGVLTDLEFYELRYGGRPASFLRGFRAIYLGLFFNVMIMATVCLAAIKIGNVLLGLAPWQSLLISSVITVAYTMVGGFKGVLFTDLFQFILAMTGMVAAAIFLVNRPNIGGLSNLLAQPKVQNAMSVFPDWSNPSSWVPIFLIPLAVQWWSSWYPGAEPGGGGYIAQRMLAAKNERHAMGATLLFNVAHYALRPWPWIIIALCSMIVFPTTADIALQFPNVDPSIIKDDLAFPAMISFLPTGLLGLVVAALIAAFMSTISTHLNWGSSYIINDFYGRFINPAASEKKMINIARFTTLGLMILASLVATQLKSALQSFNILLQIGAGTGLIFILRWFWYRINAWSEIGGMAISFLVAVYFEIFYKGGMVAYEKLIVGVLITTIGWVTITLLTKPESDVVLKKFYLQVRPHNVGWRSWLRKTGLIENNNDDRSGVGLEIGAMLIGCLMIYGYLFGIGYWIYGEGIHALISFGIGLISSFLLWRMWPKLSFS
ncbi:MAG: Na+:solute symporter [Saprospiraceae bacterium]|uniref:Na+:solute symporter n=1 Tax=Candidatus Opimibacter skivensis TaxID=2982028 RepID=A0A9D7XS18_9BACT|nr:Na+:solute symporter [Candidatus Opimibacter skivensis]